MRASKQEKALDQQVRTEIGQDSSQTPLLDPSVNPTIAATAVPWQKREKNREEPLPGRPPQRATGGSGAFSAGEAHNACSQPPRGQLEHAPLPNKQRTNSVYIGDR